MKLLGLTIQSPFSVNRETSKQQAVMLAPLRADFVRSPRKDEVSFKASRLDRMICEAVEKNDVGNFLLAIKSKLNIPCAYCGKTMVTKQLLSWITNNIDASRGEKLGELLDKARHFLAVEKRPIMRVLSNLSVEHPDLDILSLVKIQQGIEKDIYVDLQIENLNGILEKYSSRLQDPKEAVKLRRIILRLLKNAESFRVQKGAYPIKQLRHLYNKFFPVDKIKSMPITPEYLSDVAQIRPDFPIHQSFFLLDKSKSVEEFVKEILGGSTLSIEHIKPRFNNGETKLANIGLVCQECNGRRNNTNLAEFVGDSSKVEDSIRKQFAYLRGHIKGDITPYIRAVSSTYMEESAGRINLTDCIK